MDKSSYEFIIKISDLVSHYSQFSDDVCFWVACQFALESSYGTSKLARLNRNFCGMKNPFVRISTSIHAGIDYSEWADYLDLNSCIVDYLLCLQYYKPTPSIYNSVSRYSKFISKFYCPERDYIDKINSIYQQFKNYKNE